MKRLASTYDVHCCQCRREIPVDAEMYYDATAQRGKRSYCIPCGLAKATETPKPIAVAKTAAEELAELKAKLATMDTPATPAVDVDVPEVTPIEEIEEDEPVKTVSANDFLAAAIAQAVEPLIRGKLDEGKVREIAAKMIAERLKPAVHEIVVKTPAMPEGINMGRQHKQFAELLLMCTARTKTGNRLNIQLTGMGGTGKSVAAEMVAKALNMRFELVPTLSESYKFFGFMSPGTSEYVRTSARNAWEHGGVLCLDDFDGTDPTVGVELLAIRNGGMAFPDGYVKRHPDCIVLMTMNTWGHGATNDFVGRFKQDAAWLDGFVTMDWEIDEDLERDTAGHPEWVAYVQKVRANVKARGMKVLVTPRASYYGASLLEVGMPMETVKRAVLKKGMTDEQWRSVC